MATSGAVRLGSAQFTFTSTSITSPFLLALPLNLVADLSVDQREGRWIWRSMDGTGRTVVSVESSKVAFTGTVRMDDQGDRLRSFLRDAMDGSLTSLLYKPTSAASGVSVEIDSVNGNSAVTLQPDRSGIGWECSVRMVLSSTDLDNLI